MFQLLISSLTNNYWMLGGGQLAVAWEVGQQQRMGQQLAVVPPWLRYDAANVHRTYRRPPALRLQFAPIAQTTINNWLIHV